MKILHKRLLGIVSFAMAALLFYLLYFTSSDRIDLMQKTMMINNLPAVQLDRRSRCQCIELLTNIEEKLLNSGDYSKELIKFNMHCFQLPLFDPHYSINELLDTYVHDPWIEDDHNIVLQFFLDIYYDSAVLQKNQQSLLYYLLESKQIDKALNIFRQMPTNYLSEKAQKWTKEFKNFLTQILIIRAAAVKLYVDDVKLTY